MDDNLKSNILKALAVSSIGGLGYLFYENKKLKSEIKEGRKSLISSKKNHKEFFEIITDLYSKYLKLKDNLKSYVAEMYYKKMEIDQKTVQDLDIPDDYIHFFPIELKMVKLTALVDAYLYNLWSIFPEKEKNISFLGIKFDLLDDIADTEIIAEKLFQKGKIAPSDYHFIISFFKYFKNDFFMKKKIKHDFQPKEINIFENYIFNMILK